MKNGEKVTLSDGFTVRILRSHHKAVDGHAKKNFMFVHNRRSDFRIWLHATVQASALAKPVVNDMGTDRKAMVLLKAHRKLPHDHHGVPWKLLDITEGALLIAVDAPHWSMRLCRPERRSR